MPIEEAEEKHLCSSEMFGKYGKILKLVLNKANPTQNQYNTIGL
jgi:hypothetical protein